MPAKKTRKYEKCGLFLGKGKSTVKAAPARKRARKVNKDEDDEDDELNEENQLQDDDDDDLNNAVSDEDINEFKPGQTKPTPSPV